MEVPYCVICIEPLDENDATNPVTKLPGCGHKIHTKCALESAWKGNVSCPTCRRLPLPVDEMDVEDNREDAISRHNNAEMQKFFLKGIRMARTQKASRELKDAVARYHKQMEDVAKKKEEERFFNKMRKEAMQEMQGAARKVKDKYKAKVDKAGYNGRSCVSKIVVKTYNKAFNRDKDRVSRSCKRKVARAAGWKRVNAI